jgi:hypothetical protein
MMKSYRDALKTAIELGAIPAAINALVCIAELLIERGEDERAAEILALVLCYPMSRDTRELAEDLFMDLESRLCPRVITDAQARCAEITLDDLASEIIGQMAEE